MIPKLFLPPLFADTNIVPIFHRQYPTLFNATDSLFLSERLETYTYTFDVVDAPEKADLVMLPNSFKTIGEREAAYIREHEERAKALHKPFVLCIFGDLNHHVHWPGAVVLRSAQYRFLLKENEIVVPAFTRDLFPKGNIVVRGKSDRPVVSFCGFASLPGVARRIHYHLKNTFWNLMALGSFNPKYRSYKQGIYYRRKALRILRRSEKVRTHFIVRNFFSSHRATAKLPPEQLGREFLESIVNADFVLTPKGDGNYSNRFFETLSAGRLPILIDTECVLPLEKALPYDDIIVRVPFYDMRTLPERISERYRSFSENDFKAAQLKARALFVEHLRYDSFFNRLLCDIAAGNDLFSYHGRTS